MHEVKSRYMIKKKQEITQIDKAKAVEIAKKNARPEKKQFDPNAQYPLPPEVVVKQTYAPALKAETAGISLL